MKKSTAIEYGFQPETTDRVTSIRQLLGSDVLLLHWPNGSKGARRKWKHLTIDAMSDPNYLERLATGNIGVALGAKSGGLCAIDLDQNGLVQPFLKANPILEYTLQTQGARGRVFWVRMLGDYPAGENILKTAAGKSCGEWRANGCQQIISGSHPSGVTYRILASQPPVEIEYDKLDFGSFNQLLTNEGEAKRRDFKNRATASETSVPQSLCHSVTLTLCKVEDAVALALPEWEHTNHSRVWVLARAVKTLEAQGVITGRAQVISVFDDWHRQAKDRGLLRAGQSRDQYLFEFFAAYHNVKFLLTENALDQAWTTAQIEPFPPEAALFETADAKRFVGLCYQMHRLANGGEWFIPSRKAATLFGVCHATICTWLRGLVALDIIFQTQKQTAERSPRYKYVGEEKTITKEL